MRRIFAIVFYLVISPFAVSQVSRADLFAGYSYLNADTNGLTSRQSASGWEAAVSANFNKWFAAEADVSGYYKTYDILGVGIRVHDYSYGAGPRISFKPFFAHALIGGDHLSGGALGISASQDSLGGAFGGGLQWKVSGPLSVRASADYLFSRHNILGGSSVTQNNVRASVGIVYSFGGRAQTVESTRESPPTLRSTGMRVPSLGVRVVLGANPGAEISEEAPSSIAALAGLNVGDVINAVDAKVIRTPMELSVELASHTAGDKIKLGCLVRGLWQTEVVVVLEKQ